MNRMTKYEERDGVKRAVALVDHDTAITRLAEYEDSLLPPEDVIGNKKIIEMAFEDDLSRAAQLRKLAVADADGKVLVQPFVPGQQVWVVERNEYGNPYDVSGYIFVALVHKTVIVSPYINDSDDIDAALEYAVEQKQNCDEAVLEAYSVYDCFATKEDAEAHLNGSEEESW